MVSVKHSAELDQIATALAAAQAEFEAVSKDSENPFFHSKYAGLPSVVAAASPILAKHGLAVTQLLGYGYTTTETTTELFDALTTIVMHTSGQYLSSAMRLQPVPDREGRITPQAQGSATTYGRRYQYMAALGLVADEDDDGNAASASQQTVNGKSRVPLTLQDMLWMSIAHYDPQEAKDSKASWLERFGSANEQEKVKMTEELEAVLLDLGGHPELVRERHVAQFEAQS